MLNLNIADHVKGRVRFTFYRAGYLWYKTDLDLEFPIPIGDTGNGVFPAEDKGIFFMRWIRQHIESIQEEMDKENYQQ